MKTIKSILIALSVVALSIPAQSAALPHALQDITDAFTVYPSHWASGSCNSTVDYRAGTGREIDRLAVTFMSLAGPVSFSIFDSETNSSDKNAPGLHFGPNWYEGAELRLNYSYVSYVNSLNDFNSPPSALGRYRTEAYIAFYPALKQTLQLEFWVQDVATKKVVFSSDLAFARNCK